MQIFSVSFVYGQELDDIGNEKPLAINGSTSFSQLFYGVSGIESRRVPYTYFANASLNLSIYGWSIPFSFSLSNQNTSFQQPFNQYSINPSYKFVTAHLGYTSMSFSPYTVSGHIFLGAGIDVVPEGRWSLNALHGRFLKPVTYDTTYSDATPAFERMGTGFKAGYKDGKNSIDFILFRSTDDLNSIGALPDSLSIFAEENLVVSFACGTTVLKQFLLHAELAGSALTRDTRDTAIHQSHILASPEFLFTSRSSSAYYQAFKASFNYQFSGQSIGLGFERIDPGYRTHGAYFFNSDLENITINVASSLLKSKMQVNASVGTQRDNLDQEKLSSFRRMIGSINVNYTPSQQATLSAAYSTFQSFANIRSQFVDINQLSPYDNLDTLNFTQLSQSANLSFSYSLGKSEDRKQNMSVNLMYQTAADKQGGVKQNGGTAFYNTNVAYSINWVPQNILMSFSLNTSVNRGSGIDSQTFGPVLSLSHTFFDKKFRLMFSSSYNNTNNQFTSGNAVLNFKTSGALTLKKKHVLTLSAAMIERKTNNAEQKSFTEFTGNVGYVYSFGL
ncbi:hypothetical protein SanaruYs_19590 [Chryseotalea sanaruensis]|uniref:Uncharacterized protein n=2 Tax=Chryseotalea sanaruensis TaxID=2482724 RepID=A0A401UA26_9BACT|nr:hypothetical protein SanaruYs_19590 [Chryseotalea sanaruensis]